MCSTYILCNSFQVNAKINILEISPKLLLEIEYFTRNNPQIELSRFSGNFSKTEIYRDAQ